MYKFITGNILSAGTEAIVNTVNTYGVMGKGIALAFKKSFPSNYQYYRRSFEKGELEIGRMNVYKTGLLSPTFIINFPTKKHWRYKSKIEYISLGLNDLVKVIENNDIKSIAIPPLGCGNGGLDWSRVKELIMRKLDHLKESIEIIIYEPGYDLKLRSVKALTELNPTRAMYLQIIRQYELLGENITTLSVQKLAYLLQRMGANLNLRFDKGIYGPYSPNLNKVIEALSPNYLTYDGDLNKPTTLITLQQDKKSETKHIIEHELSSEQKGNLNGVLELIKGFESAFGLELLSTVAFTIEQCPECSKNEIIADIHNWTKRKKELMNNHMVSISFDRLKEFSL